MPNPRASTDSRLLLLLGVILTAGVLSFLLLGGSGDDDSSRVHQETALEPGGAAEAPRRNADPVPPPRAADGSVAAPPEVLEPGALWGFVLDSAGQGLKAEVRVVPAKGLKAVSTDDDGRFDIRGELPPGPFSVYAKTPAGDAAHADEIFADASPLRIVIQRAPILEGRVVGPDDQGIGGAEVTLRWHRRGSPEAQARQTTTDAQGYFVLPAPALLPDAADQSFLDVRAEGFAPKRRAQLVGMRTSLAEMEGLNFRLHCPTIRLERGRKISGVVRDHVTGEPRTGATVDLLRFLGCGIHDVFNSRGEVETRRSPLGPTVLASVTTDENGRFRFEGVPTGLPEHERGSLKPWGALRATATGAPPAAVEIDFEKEDRDDLVIEILPGIRLSGRVVDVDGTPVAGADIPLRVTTGRRVHLQPNGNYDRNKGFDEAWAPSREEGGSGYLKATSDAEGRFAFPSVPRSLEGGTLGKLGLRRPPHARFGGGWFGDEVTAPAVDDFDLGDLRFREHKARDIATLIVQDEDGRPIAGARLRSPGGDALNRSDAQGRISVYREETRGYLAEERQAWLYRAGFVPTSWDFDARFPVDPLVVTMPRAHRLAGRVLFRDGTPAVGGHVTFHPSKTRMGWWGGSRGLGDKSETIGRDGRWMFSALPREPFRLEAVWNGTKELRIERSFDSWPEDETEIELRFEENRSPAGRLEIRLADAAGNPVRADQTWVSWLEKPTESDPKELRKKENFVFEGHPGRYRGRVRGEGRAPIMFEVEIEVDKTATQTLRFPLSCRAILRIAGAPSPRPQLTVRAQPVSGFGETAQQLTVGEPADMLLAPGRWRFEILNQNPGQHPAWSVRKIEADLQPGLPVEITIELKPLAEVAIEFDLEVDMLRYPWTVVVGDGANSRRYQLRAWHPPHRSYSLLLEAGTRQFQLHNRDGLVLERTLTLEAGGRAKVRVSK
jgi:protocatechuate 3,4-dioxygenase beta subunit